MEIEALMSKADSKEGQKSSGKMWDPGSQFERGFLGK